MRRPRLLDLFCGAGGAAMGYHRAGFDVVGVDIKPQPRYQFAFYQADAMTFTLDGYDAIHASPPCQRFSQATPRKYRAQHPDLIAPIRIRLIAAGVPFVIENVRGAHVLLRTPIRLCGSQFGLQVWRHRYFECGGGFQAPLTSPCRHDFAPTLITGTTRRKSRGRIEYTAQECRDAADLQWMTRKEMDEAIPPAYTEFIGRQLMRVVHGSQQGAA